MAEFPGRTHDLIVGAVQQFAWGNYAITNVASSAQDPSQTWPSDLADAILGLIQADSTALAGGDPTQVDSDWLGAGNTDPTNTSGTGEIGA